MTEDLEIQAIDLLAAGFGVEDIAQRLKLPLAEIQTLVSDLRRIGVLADLFSGGAQ